MVQYYQNMLIFSLFKKSPSNLDHTKSKRKMYSHKNWSAQ